MDKQLIFHTLNPQQQQKLSYFQEQGISPLLAKAWAIRHYEKAEKLIHYSLLQDMDTACKVLSDALLNEKEICVVADYDVDGATSCSIMTGGLRMMGNPDTIHYFVPDRMKHGYGLQPSVIDDLLLSFPETNLIVTVDNGIASIDGVAYAKEKGIGVVVTDHHLEGDTKPKEALCIVNPNRKTCTFPSKALAGCGVAFYTVKALYDYFQKSDSEHPIVQKAKTANLVSLADYAAIGTVADLVPLDANNRLLVELGLSRIRKGKANIGVRKLIEALELNEAKLNTSDIAFKIAPTLNAAGRLENMAKGIDTLMATNGDWAFNSALELREINDRRKNLEREMKDSALEQIELLSPEISEEFFSCCVFDEGFHEGVIGIIASRLKEQFYVPSLVFAPMEEKHKGRAMIKGSGRSIGEIHLRDALDYVSKKCPDSIVKFGGHSMAAGLSIYRDKFDEVAQTLNEYVKTHLKGVRPSALISIDDDLTASLSHIGIEDVENLNQAIWGQGFNEPVYYLEGEIVSQRVLKSKKVEGVSHLKIELLVDGKTLNVMRFFVGEPFDSSQKLKVVGKLSVNEWLGEKSIQMIADEAWQD